MQSLYPKLSDRQLNYLNNDLDFQIKESLN